MEGIAASHSDSLLLLDELAQCDAKIIGDTVYMLGNNRGKARATDRGTLRTSIAEWRLIYLSSGEKKLEEYMAAAGQAVKPGQEVRLVAIPSDAGSGQGIFNELHNCASGADLSRLLCRNSSRYYGLPFYSFTKSLAEKLNQEGERKKLAERIIREQASFRDRCNLSEGADGQVIRVADRFGLVGFAGELATSAGITGWEKGEAWAAASKCFRAWLDLRGGEGSLEDRQILDQVRSFFDSGGEYRFTRWDVSNIQDQPNVAKIDEHQPRTPERCGFRRTIELEDTLEGNATETFYLVFPQAFKKQVCKGFDPARVAALLHQNGALEKQKSSDSYQVSVRVPGHGRGKSRLYKIFPHRIGQSDAAGEVGEADRCVGFES